MQTPTSSRKRNKPEDTEFKAQRDYFVERAGSHASKSVEKFNKRVLKAINGDKPTGHYISTFTATLQCKINNAWHTVERGDANTYLTFFQPLQFKDAEAILFLNKQAVDCTTSTTGWASTTGNNTKLSNVRVINSSVFMNLKSNSSMKMILEIYEVSGTSTASNLPETNFGDIWNGYAASTLNAGQPGTKIVGLPLVTAIRATINHVPAILQDFKVKKTVIKFQPGEEATHFIQGPKNYTMNSEKKILPDGSWPNWTLPGNGIKVMFRVISDINMGYYTDGTAPATSEENLNLSSLKYNIGHFNNTSLASTGGPGGILCEIIRNYTIESPDGFPPVPIGAPAALENFRPACVLLNNYNIMTSSATLQVMNMVPGTGTPGADPTRD